MKKNRTARAQKRNQKQLERRKKLKDREMKKRNNPHQEPHANPPLQMQEFIELMTRMDEVEDGSCFDIKKPEVGFRYWGTKNGLYSHDQQFFDIIQCSERDPETGDFEMECVNEKNIRARYNSKEWECERLRLGNERIERIEIL